MFRRRGAPMPTTICSTPRSAAVSTSDCRPGMSASAPSARTASRWGSAFPGSAPGARAEQPRRIARFSSASSHRPSSSLRNPPRAAALPDARRRSCRTQRRVGFDARSSASKKSRAWPRRPASTASSPPSRGGRTRRSACRTRRAQSNKMSSRLHHAAVLVHRVQRGELVAEVELALRARVVQAEVLPAFTCGRAETARQGIRSAGRYDVGAPSGTEVSMVSYPSMSGPSAPERVEAR